VSEGVQVAGCVAAAACVAAALLASDRRLRAGALVAAIAIAGALLIGEAWDELEPLRDRPVALALGLILLSALVAGLAAGIRRAPLLLPVLLVAALPFRVPIEVGSDEANLLVPLYVVIGAGVLASLVDALREGGRRPGSEPRLLLAALAAAVVLYALQASYSEDVGFATRNVGFFLVPFAAMFVLLADVPWTGRALGLSFAVLAGESVLFALAGVGQQAMGEIFWNPALERSNEFHFYFRANSLFWDPNIYGRYLALAAVIVVAVVLWTRDMRRLAVMAGVLAALLAGLVAGLSQTSFIAVLAGSAVIVGLRWSAARTAFLAPVALVAVLAAVIVVGGTSEAENEASEVSSGRTTLFEGGWDLFQAEPVAGHGSASFSAAFSEQEDIGEGKTTVSHNEPLTVAAEQGLIGLLVYAALLVAAGWTLLTGMRAIAPGLGASEDAVGDPWAGGAAAAALARIAMAGAFAALVVHTVGYGGFLSDPLTWALLAVGGSLAGAAAASRPAAR
jgi:putative inorganic carbon (hco3(-)) transporter